MARVAVFFSASVLAGLVGRATYLPESEIVLISPLAGVSFLWLASSSRRTWRWDVPALSLAGALVVVLAQGPTSQIVMGLVLTLVQPVVTVVLVLLWAGTSWGSGSRMALSSTRDLAIFLAASAVGAAAASAVRGTGLGLLPPLDAAGSFMVWIRNFCWVIGIGAIGLMVAPSLTRMRGVASLLNVRTWLARNHARLLEAFMIYLATLALYVVSWQAAVVFPVMMVTVWAGLRLSPVAATTHALISGTFALVLTLYEVQIFAYPPDQIQAAAWAQGFMIALVLTAASVSLTTRARDAAIQRALLSEAESIGRAALLTAVLEHMNAGVVVLHADGTETLRNPAGRRILGLPPGLSYDEAMPGPRFGVFDAQGRRYQAEELPHALALRGVDTPTRDYLVRTPQVPEGVVLEITASHHSGQGPGQPDKAIINFQDVTIERQERDAELSTAQEDERKHLSRELHDNLGQILTSASLFAKAASLDLPPERRELPDRVRSLINDALAATRSLTWTLRSSEQSDSLEGRLQQLVEDVSAGSDTKLDLEFRGHGRSVSVGVQSVVFRIVQEALTNVVRHAQARHAWVWVTVTGGQVCVVVNDDGGGFDAQSTAARMNHVGLASMEERAHELGGTLTIDSRPGWGTTVRFNLAAGQGDA